MKRHEFNIGNLLTFAGGPAGSDLVNILLIFLVSWTFTQTFLGQVAILRLMVFLGAQTTLRANRRAFS